MRYLNDASEFQFFVDMVKEAQEIVRPTQAGLVKKDILSDGVETLLGLTGLFTPESKFLSFVAYDQDGNLTEEWAESIIRLFADKKLPENQVIDAFLKNDPKYTFSNTSLSLTMRPLSIGQGFKNPAFSEESEWRAVSSLTPVIKTPPGQMDNRVSFRPGKHMIIPYTDFKLTDDKNLDLPIEEFMVGPSPHVELCRASVQARLIGQNVSSVKVKSSLVPYRPV